MDVLLFCAAVGLVLSSLVLLGPHVLEFIKEPWSIAVLALKFACIVCGLTLALTIYLGAVSVALNH